MAFGCYKLFFFSLYNSNSKKGDVIKTFPSISAKIPLEKIEDRFALKKELLFLLECFKKADSNRFGYWLLLQTLIVIHKSL